jgi:predicted DCC family thiol-disulfide oxidoreductase YuxK
MSSNENSQLQVVFFDGVCNLCNGFVDWILRNQKRPPLLKLASLQGQTAKQYLSEEDRSALSSVIFWQDGKIYRESTAILMVFSNLRFPWPWLSMLAHLFPPFVRDSVYKLVANNRYKWFGQRETCRLPKPEEKAQLWP